MLPCKTIDSEKGNFIQNEEIQKTKGKKSKQFFLSVYRYIYSCTRIRQTKGNTVVRQKTTTFHG